MDRKDGKQWGSLVRKGIRSGNRNVLVFAFFLILAFVFWYLNSLGKELETDIRYPVKYSNIPGNRSLSGNMPSRLNLFLKGPGYSILRLKISGNSLPVAIDFSKATIRRTQNNKSGDYYIVTSNLVTGFNSQLKSVCKITSIKPDTLFFSFRQTEK